LLKMSAEERVKARIDKFSRMGVYSE
jgi:hypothetical protein